MDVESLRVTEESQVISDTKKKKRAWILFFFFSYRKQALMRKRFRA